MNSSPRNRELPPPEPSLPYPQQKKETSTLDLGEIVRLKQGERDSLVGLDSWGIVAEIWQHTDGENPSNEDDIVRIEDDFGR